MVDAAKTGAWDIAFLGIDPAREGEIGFTAAYLEIEATYLVPAGSPLSAVADVDREGVRGAAPARANHERRRSRSLARAAGARGRARLPARLRRGRQGLRPGGAGDREDGRARRLGGAESAHSIVASARIPDFLYGTAWKEDRTPALTELALRAGFRGIDTANQRRHYFEAGVGQGLAAAYRPGVLTAVDLFLQTEFTSQPGRDPQ